MHKKVVSCIGILVLLLGIILAGIGIADFFSAMGNMERPKLFFLTFIGFPLFAVGAAMLVLANARTMQKNAMRRITDMNSILNGQKIVCPSCGKTVENGDFCSSCGTKLKPDQ